MSSTKNLIKRWFKLRFAIIYPFGIFVALFSNPSDFSFRASLIFIAAGLLIRIWANGYAIKLDKLTVSGPYAYVRHPLYFGTMLIAVGFCIMLRTYWIGAGFIAVMTAVYYRTVQKEEQMLAGRHGNVYREYKKKVPAFFPTVIPYRKGERWPFSLERLNRSKEYKLFLWIIIIVIGFSIKKDLVVNQEAMDASKWLRIWCALGLALIDIGTEIHKYYRKARPVNS